MDRREILINKWFNRTAILTGILALADIICYNVLSYKEISPAGQFWTKLVPIPLFLLLPVIYQMVYKINTYSMLIIIGLSFCWIGDLFLLFYSPQNSKTLIYFYLGGISFFLARCFWIFMLFLFPEGGCYFLRYDKNKLGVTLLVSETVYTGFGIFFYFNSHQPVLRTLILIYFILGFGPPVSLAYLRIGGLSQETFRASVLTFAGLLCFNFSDTILFFSLLSKIIPLKWSFLSNNIYWTAMYLLALSSSRENFNAVIQYPEGFY